MVTKLTLVRRAVASLLALWSTVCFAAAEVGGQPGPAPGYSANERIVVFADVHGAYDELVTLLRATRVVDANLDWAGGATYLVSLGDLIDRGPKSRQVLDLVMRLQQQAGPAGGAVRIVLGNHELMNLTGDLRYVVAEDYAAFAGDETPPLRAAAFERYRAGRGSGLQADAAKAAFDAKFPAGYFARQEAFTATGRYGAWLASQPIVMVIGDYAFIHGGLAPVIATSTVEELNDQFHRDVGKLLGIKARIDAAGYVTDDAAELARATQPDATAPTGADESTLAANAAEFVALLATPLLSDGGPLWYRGTALCHGLIEQNVADHGLAALHVKAAIIGHTPTSDRRVQQRFAGKVVMLDTGMLEPYFHGHPAALVLEAGRANVVYGDGVSSSEIEDSDAVVRSGWSRESLERFLADAPIGESHSTTSTELALQLRDGPRTLPAMFVAGNKSSSNAQLAAYRLDVLLGLNLVPVSVARTVDGVAGVIATAPDRAITEAERRQQQQVRPIWCASGNDYQLMYVFDALIGNVSRTALDVSYDRTSWQMQLTGNGAAFPTARTLPKTADTPARVVPSALAQRLAQLDFDTLQREFGELLNKQQLKALLARRDAILATWQRAD